MAVKDINTPAVAGQIDAANELRKSSDATKAQIAYNKAAEAAAQQAAEPVVAPPTGNPSKVSAPVITNLTFEDRLRDRFEKEYAEEKRKEEERLKKTRLGYGISGIAASIGDMVRASEGAPVNPRDWQKIYDDLTAQEKANINNYQVRMAKLREDARADRKAAAAAAASAEATKQQRDYEVVKDYIERNFKGDQAEKDRMLKWLSETMKAESREKVANIKAKGNSRKSNQYTTTMLGDTSYQIPKGETFKNYVYSVLSVLDNDASYNGSKKTVTITQDGTLETDPFGFYNKNIIDILRNNWDDLTPQAKKEIETSVYGHGGVKGNNAPGGGWDGGDGDYDD